MAEPLRDQRFFDKVSISFGVSSWPNGFDVDAINLSIHGASRRQGADPRRGRIIKGNVAETSRFRDFRLLGRRGFVRSGYCDDVLAAAGAPALEELLAKYPL